MIQIQLNNIGKRYNFEWIFRKVNYDFTPGNNYVILGGNGSGKSTLLQTIAGNLTHSEGDLKFLIEDAVIDPDHTFKYLSICTPYLDLFEEFTLEESVAFQQKFKPFRKGLDAKQIIELTGLEKSKDKLLKYYSSGMKQRVRLALAVLADTPLLLLDEPASNLDKNAINWYQQLVKDNSTNRLIIVASNQQEYEYPFCNQQLTIEDYKSH